MEERHGHVREREMFIGKEASVEDMSTYDKSI